MALSRALVLLTLGLSAACSEDSEQPVFLGAAGSATFEAPPTFIPGAAGAAGAAGSGGASAGAAGSPRCGLALTVPSADQVATLERDGASYALTVGASVTHVFGLAGWTVGPAPLAAVVLLIAAVVGSLAFGAYLAALTATGLESTQALTALGHRGYKHFVRFRVRRDGRGVDAWVIGLADPLDERVQPALVDAFSWGDQGATDNS